MEMINLEYVIDGVYLVYFNKKKIGEFVVQDDGYYSYVMKNNLGFCSSYGLRLIADKLDELNKEWDEQIKKDIGNGK
jgi:hypothetical protein